VRAIRAYNEAVNNFKGGWQPQLSLELALIDCLTSQPEMVVVQQAAPAAQATAAAPTERPPVRQDATPSVPSASINEKWDRVLKSMYRYSKTSPDVMRYFRVQRVEGNTVYLCTDNEVYYKRIQPYPEKRQIIEKALADVFHTQMLVQVVLVSTGDLEAMNNGMATESRAAIDSSDSLLSTGIELGAEIKKLDKPAKPAKPKQAQAQDDAEAEQAPDEADEEEG
jgi:hypothetical protein